MAGMMTTTTTICPKANGSTAASGETAEGNTTIREADGTLPERMAEKHLFGYGTKVMLEQFPEMSGYADPDVSFMHTIRQANMELPGQMVETQWDGYTIKEIISMPGTTDAVLMTEDREAGNPAADGRAVWRKTTRAGAGTVGRRRNSRCPPSQPRTRMTWAAARGPISAK